MQACANDFWAVLRDYAAPPPAAVLTQQVMNKHDPSLVTNDCSSSDVLLQVTICVYRPLLMETVRRHHR